MVLVAAIAGAAVGVVVVAAETTARREVVDAVVESEVVSALEAVEIAAVV